MKKLSRVLALSCAVVIGIVYIPKLIYVSTFQHQQLTLDPQRDVFAFDLHGVVFRPDYKTMISRAYHGSDAKFIYYALTHPSLLYDFFKLRKESSVPEQYIADLIAVHPFLTPYIEKAIDIINEQIPMIPTIDYIKQLKQQGFKVYVFSNIGKHTFEKFRIKFKDIFDLFDGYSVTDPDDRWIQKPNAEAYYKFLAMFNVQPEHVIFVDDQANNIKGAQKVGISTILFRCPQDLPRILTK